MIDDSPLLVDDDQPQPKSYLRSLKITLAVFFLGFVYVWFFIPANFINNPVAFQRDEQGQLKQVGGNNNDAKGNLALHAGGLTSTNITLKSTSMSNSDPAYFSSRSLIILNLSGHPLMNRIGKELVELFKNEKQFDRLEYYPFDHFPEAGINAPDQFMTLQLGSITESGLMGQTLDAQVIATLGDDIQRSNSNTIDHLTPPLIRFKSTISLEHHSNLNGVESSGARYQMQGKNIAKVLIKQVQSTLNEYRDKFAVIPELESGFYPAWEKSPAFQFLDKYKARMLTSTHGLMFHNETFWSVEDIDDPEQLIEEFVTELKKLGWRGESSEKWSSLTPSLRMTKGSKIFKLFRPRNHTGLGNETVSHPIYIRYHHRSNTKELNAAIEQLLKKENPDYNLLLSLRRYASHDQRNQIIETVVKNPSSTTETWIALAEYYASKKDQQKTIDALKRLHHLTFSEKDPSKAEGRINSIAKKMELDLKQIKTIDLSLFEELGFVRLSKESQVQQVPLSENGKARFLLVEKDKPWKALTIQVTPILVSKNSTYYNVLTLETNGLKKRNWNSSTVNGLSSPYNSCFAFHEPMGNFTIEKQADSSLQVTVKFD